MLDIQHLTVAREGRIILHDVSLFVAPGEVLAVVGPNGSGKSTFAQALSGAEAIQVTEGKIFFRDEDITSLLPEERFLRGIFLVHQDPPALPGVTFEAVARAMRRHRVEPAGEFFLAMRQALTTVGLAETFIDAPLFVACSGGEKKRLELALVLLAQPKLLILDELDSGLDEASRLIALEIVKRFCAQGTSVLLISHNESFLAGFPGVRRIAFALSQ